jgi:hypothetical protein
MYSGNFSTFYVDDENVAADNENTRGGTANNGNSTNGTILGN